MDQLVYPFLWLEDGIHQLDKVWPPIWNSLSVWPNLTNCRICANSQQTFRKNVANRQHFFRRKCVESSKMCRIAENIFVENAANRRKYFRRKCVESHTIFSSKMCLNAYKFVIQNIFSVRCRRRRVLAPTSGLGADVLLHLRIHRRHLDALAGSMAVGKGVLQIV
jgi:hypothetical protein